MRHTYKTVGTCSREISFDIEDGKVYNIVFAGGCPGNTIGVSKLAEGRDAKELINMLKGTKCGFKPTSCPDQLALAIEKAIEK